MSTRSTIAALLIALAPLAARPAQAQRPPETHVAGDPGAAPDTSQFLPDWIRPWLEIGGGWMTGPKYVSRHYESGQGFGAGLEARFANRWALRLGMNYQILQANHDDSLLVITAVDASGAAVLDTANYSYQSSAWLGTLALEPGVRVIGDFWLTGGLGVGYMRSGFDGSDVEFDTINPPALPGALRSGWGWEWTAAARWDFQPAPQVPLGIEVRSSSMQRRGDDVRTWAFRICYRVPWTPASAQHHGRGRRGDPDR